MRHSFRSRAAEDTAAVAEALARVLRERAPASAFVVALIGGLGAGKTVFVKGLAAGLGIDPAEVASPTFVLASQYACDHGTPLHHVDLYRLDSEAELETMGFFDLLEPGAVVAVEWGDRFPDALPADRLEVHIARPADGGGGTATGRVLEIDALGPLSAEVLAGWRRALEAG